MKPPFGRVRRNRSGMEGNPTVNLSVLRPSLQKMSRGQRLAYLQLLLEKLPESTPYRGADWEGL